MNDREQFETWCLKNVIQYALGDDSMMDRMRWNVWQACAESKQSELDKANARIAQLEDALQIAHKYMNHLPSFGEDRAPVIRALKGSSDTWLSEHDKAVEVKVLEEAAQKCRYYLKNQNYQIYENTNDPYEHGVIIATENIEDILIKMIESRK